MLSCNWLFNNPATTVTNTNLHPRSLCAARPILMEVMQRVTDSLMHDLRSPLTRAKGAIEMALRRPAQSDGNDVEGYRQGLEQTATELETILRTFESLINIAQAEAGLNRLTPIGRAHV